MMQEMNAMGALSLAADAVVVIYSLTVAITAPLVVAQGILPRRLFPAPLVAFKVWYAAKFGDYLTAESPAFYRGLNWLELAFQWPLNIANLYGILARRPWSATTSLMAGVSTLTSMAAILGDIVFSGRATRKLLLVYVPFAVFAVVAILRGLTSADPGSSLAQSAWKKII